MKDLDRILGNNTSEDSSGPGITRGRFIYYLLMLLPILGVLLGACGGGQESSGRRSHP
jgi:hypothetical protein